MFVPSPWPPGRRRPDRIAGAGLFGRLALWVCFSAGSCAGDRPVPVRPGAVVQVVGLESDQANRAISKAQLHALLRFHMPPIDVVVYDGSNGETWF